MLSVKFNKNSASAEMASRLGLIDNLWPVGTSFCWHPFSAEYAEHA